MNISKTTFNFAKKRGLDITVEDLGDCIALCIWEADKDCEWMCSYRIESDKLAWNANVYLPQEVKEELPATIKDEKHLREVLAFIAKEVNSTNC